MTAILPSCLLTLFLISFALASAPYEGPIDETLLENAKGVDVVDAVIRKIRKSSIFVTTGYHDDFNLLSRLAFVQTNFGQQLTPDPQHDGGIWALNKPQFDTTLTQIPDHLWSKIYTHFQISWNVTLMTHTECRRPLISGLALSIFVYLNRLPDESLETMEEQGTFMFDNGVTVVTSEEYVEKSKTLEPVQACQISLDITVILGGSAAPNLTFEETTELEKQFVSKLFAAFPKSYDLRLGLVGVSGDQVDTRISLESPYDDQQIQWIVQTTGFSSDEVEKTRINEGIMAAVQMINGTSTRDGHKVVLTFSHRESSEDGVVSNIAYAWKLYQTTYAITLATSPVSDEHDAELLNLARNEAQNLWRVGQTGLPQFGYRFAQELCDVQLYMFPEAYSTLGPGEKRYHWSYTSDYPYQIISLRGYGDVDSFEIFVSFHQIYPSSALYQFKFVGMGPHVVPLPLEEMPQKIYVTVKNPGDTQTGYAIRHSHESATTTTTTSTRPTVSTTTGHSPANTILISRGLLVVLMVFLAHFEF